MGHSCLRLHVWSEEKRRIGLCLVGGGLAGSVQAGMLYALYPMFRRQLIAGMECASVGSLNGALVAQAIDEDGVVSHMHFDKIMSIWKNIRRKDIYSVWKIPLIGTSSYFSTAPLKKLLKEHLDEDRVCKSPIRLFVQACHRDTGRSVVWTQGMPDLKTMLLASSAFPVAFPQVQHPDGYWFVDAGVGDNSPMDCLLGTPEFESCDTILVLNCHTENYLDKTRRSEGPMSRVNMLFHLINLIYRANQHRDEDALIRRNQMIRGGMIKGKIIRLHHIHPRREHATALSGTRKEIQAGFSDGFNVMTEFLHMEIDRKTGRSKP